MAIRQENTWYKGNSIDSYMGAEGTFWYSKNIDIRNDLKGIQLLSKPDERTVSSKLVCYVKYNINQMLRLYENGDLTIGNNLAFSETTIGALGMSPQGATKFRDWVYVFSYDKIKRFQIVAGSMASLTDITPADRVPATAFTFYNSGLPVLNFWNSAILVGRGNKLWRGLPVTPTGPVPSGGWKEMRTFDVAEIRGIVGRSSNIEVYTDYNSVDSRIYFIGGFWDAVDTGISNTIVLENLSISQIGQIGEKTFVVCNNLSNIFETSLYEISGYSKHLIKKSVENGGDATYHSDFRFPTAYQTFPVSGSMLYLPFYDQVWSYGREGDDIGDNLCALWAGKVFISGVAFADYLYFSEANGTSYKEYRYDTGYRHNNYIDEDGILISRIFDGGMMGLRKQLISMNIGYKIDNTGSPANAGSIEIYLRTDMEDYNVTDGWIKVVTIDDVSQMREIVEATQLQAAGIDDFSTIQYKVIIKPGSVRTVSPILYELTFNYDDQIKSIT